MNREGLNQFCKDDETFSIFKDIYLNDTTSILDLFYNNIGVTNDSIYNLKEKSNFTFENSIYNVGKDDTFGFKNDNTFINDQNKLIEKNFEVELKCNEILNLNLYNKQVENSKYVNSNNYLTSNKLITNTSIIEKMKLNENEGKSTFNNHKKRKFSSNDQQTVNKKRKYTCSYCRLRGKESIDHCRSSSSNCPR